MAIGFLVPLGHPAIVLSLAEASKLDSSGIAAVADAAETCARERALLVLVTGTGKVARVIAMLGMEPDLPVFSSEAEAEEALELRFGRKTWTSRAIAEAKQASVSRLRAILEQLPRAPLEETARLITEMLPLCERSEIEQRAGAGGEHGRCEICPLFHAAGGTREDLGCTRVLNPILEALSRGDLMRARSGLGSSSRRSKGSFSSSGAAIRPRDTLGGGSGGRRPDRGRTARDLCDRRAACRQRTGPPRDASALPSTADPVTSGSWGIS